MTHLERESVSEYLARRRVVDRGELVRCAMALAGRYRSGYRDLAEHHDAHLDGAFDPGHASSTRRPSPPVRPRQAATRSSQ